MFLQRLSARCHCRSLPGSHDPMRLQGWLCKKLPSVHLLDGGAASTAAGRTSPGPWHTSLRHATSTSGLVDLHHDRIHDALHLLLLALELLLLCELVLVEPIQGLLHHRLDLLLVSVLELFLQLLLLERVSHGEAVVLQAILGLDLRAVRLVLGPVLLSLLHHAVDL